MREIHVDFTGEKPLDVPWPEEIEEVRKELQGLEDIDLVQLFQEISKIRLAVVKAGRKRAQEGPTPLSEEKGVRFLTTAINELRRLTPEVTNMKERIEESVREDFMLQLFPIIDSFDRFFASVREVSDPKLEKWVEGIRGVYNSVLVLLRNNNVKEIPTKGTFNPKYQAAVGTEIRNELPPGTILSVERRGFVIGSKILRTPELIISKRD
ncbi:nucleotide exchange factor GrpE, partial [bacterium]|nr:nucleotide exchange factor GrpE [bacterium]